MVDKININYLIILVIVVMSLTGCATTKTQKNDKSTVNVWGFSDSKRYRGNPNKLTDRKSETKKTKGPVNGREIYTGEVDSHTTKKAYEEQAKRQLPEDGHVFNFVDTPISNVVDAFAKICGSTIIVDQDVKAKVTLHSGGPVPEGQVIKLLEGILSVNGAALIVDGQIYRVVPSAKAKDTPLAVNINSNTINGYAIEIFYLKNIPVNDAAKTVKPFISSKGEMVTLIQSNLLVVADEGDKLRKLQKLVELIDRPIAARVHVKIYPVHDSDVNAVVADLRKLFTAMGVPDSPKSGVWTNLIPLDNLRSIAVVSTYKGAFRTVEQWLSDLERQITETEETVFVYYCQNGSAINIANVLNGLYGQSHQSGLGTNGNRSPSITPTKYNLGGTSDHLRENVGNKLDTVEQNSYASNPNSVNTSNIKMSQYDSSIQNNIRFVVDQENNAIVIRSPRKKLTTFLRTIGKLDSFPKQVLIEVTIAEIQLDDMMSLGIEWATHQNPSGNTTLDAELTHPESLLPSSGLLYAITRTDEILASIRALAQDKKMNVIASPILLAAENMESKINVGDEVPIITTLTTSEDLSTTDGRKITDRSIKYRDTGVILTVVPRVNDSGLVRLGISLEITDISSTSFGETESPAFFSRVAKTNVVTVDRQTVVIGGLIKEEHILEDSGIPFLKDIPGLGYLFKAEKETTERKELILTLTPHVIHSMEDAQELVRSMESHLKRINNR